MDYKNVKGTHDVFLKEADDYSYVEQTMKMIAELFSFKEVRPPVLEYSEVFVRSVGDSSDIVRKEMYTFLDKGNRSITLRPEFTAGIVRLVNQNKLLFNNELPLKTYYCGPVFRYERPQLGRYRQFNQFGVEALGHNSPYVDIDVIVLAYTILNSLGLENVTLKINTLGDDASREAYKKALKDYFANFIDNMCEDCKNRFVTNPLRILDCKVPEDQEIAKKAPKIFDYLSNESKDRFEIITTALDEMGIPYEIDDQLVRGLDYYSETVFEFHYTSNLGNNYGAIGAGGHYGNLIHELGGEKLPGVGFSFGVERIVSVLKDNNLLDNKEDSGLMFYVMPLDKKCNLLAEMITNQIRIFGYSADMCFDNIKVGSMFKRADKRSAKYAILLGEDELNNNKFVLKNLSTKEQSTYDLEDLEEVLNNELENDEHECCCGHDHEHCQCHHDE